MEAGDFNIQSCSTAPYNCVVTNCNELLYSSTVLSHFLTIHQKNNVEFQAVNVDEKILMVVSTHESFLQLNQSVCLGVLGVRLDKSDHFNAMLKDEFKIFSHHIPVLIMACRGNYGEKYASRNYDSGNDFVCFWLITPQLKQNTRRLHAIITIHDEDLNNSLSSSMDTRRIDSTQRVDEFMHNETNFLIVNAGMLHKITNENSLFLEIEFKDELL
jgi:hypothetical protein